MYMVKALTLDLKEDGWEGSKGFFMREAPMPTLDEKNNPSDATSVILKIRYAGFPRARIVEYRGPLGPGGMRIYRVRAPMKPKPFVAEVREDQIEAILPDPGDAAPKSL